MTQNLSGIPLRVVDNLTMATSDALSILAGVMVFIIGHPIAILTVAHPWSSIFPTDTRQEAMSQPMAFLSAASKKPTKSQNPSEQ